MVRSRYKTADLDDVIKDYKEKALPAIATHEGGRSGMLLVNRETGEAISLGFYENESAAKAFAPKAEKLIGTFERYLAGGPKPTREVYEIAASTQHEARATVERLLKAFNAHDLEAAARESAPDSVLTAPGDATVKGPQAIKEFNTNWITAFPDAEIETKTIFAMGNQVAIDAVFSGTHDGTLKTPMGDVPATGRKVKGEFLEVFEVDRGLIKNAHLMFDQVQLMTQLGMAPAPPQQAVKTAR
ncbi:MAG TPA: ester cyclase [Candidatus Dormibacteraeota bacterium]|nr:ester cyclase [Candidatus Dormibacteraeota bacterium]